MRFDAVFFDSGGTLFARERADRAPDPSPAEVRERRTTRLALALRGLGYTVDEARLCAALPGLEATCPRHVGPAYTYADLMLAVAESLGLAFREEDAAACADAYVGPRYRSWLSPGTEQTLRTLTEAGVYVGLISNTYIPGCTADRMFRGVGLLRYLKTRVYSGDEGLAKPDPRIFRLAEERAGLSGRRLLYVGDKEEKDIAPAHAAGWAAALKRSSVETGGGLADFEFDEMPELLPFVLT